MQCVFIKFYPGATGNESCTVTYIAREQVHFYHRSILLLGKPFIAFVQELSERAEFVHVGVWVNITHSGAPIQRSAGGAAQMCSL